VSTRKKVTKAQQKRILARARKEPLPWEKRPILAAIGDGREFCVFSREHVERLDSLLAQVREEFRKALGGAL
jgi:hypothetical protein